MQTVPLNWSTDLSTSINISYNKSHINILNPKWCISYPTSIWLLIILEKALDSPSTGVYFSAAEGYLQCRKQPSWRWRICCAGVWGGFWLAAADLQYYTPCVGRIDWLHGTCIAPGSGTWWKYNKYKYRNVTTQRTSLRRFISACNSLWFVWVQNATLFIGAGWRFDRLHMGSAQSYYWLLQSVVGLREINNEAWQGCCCLLIEAGGRRTAGVRSMAQVSQKAHTCLAPL